MIVCSCRNIRESDFKDKKDLYERLKREDYRCGMCLQGIEEIEELVVDVS